MAVRDKSTHSPKQMAERAEAHPMAVPFLWLGSAKVQRNFIFVPLVGMIVFSILGYFFPPAHKAPWEASGNFWFSYTVIGFISYSFVVLAAWPLFRLLSRPENYYGEDDNEDILPNSKNGNKKSHKKGKKKRPKEGGNHG